MDLLSKVVTDIETHSVEGIDYCFRNGLDPDTLYRGDPLIYELTSEYARTPKFKECVKVFNAHGMHFPDKALLAVLMDDAETLRIELAADATITTKTCSLRCAYTPLDNVSLLHVCAEFNHTACATLLLAGGADVDATAGIDSNGFGAQTPIYHTVNQNSDNSAEMLNLLLLHQADLSIAVKGIIWGRTYPWETFIPAVNPISYCMMGLLPQVHRNEKTISITVSKLLEHAYGINYELPNIPNHYLQ